MRIDVVTIFPGYLDPLSLSLPGRARRAGLLDLRVHDLRSWTHDRHRTVDDTPYGGGAGMVLRPEPWGEALDALELGSATVVVPTPAGTPFTQELAQELATRDRLIVACGRYEGIDQRVVEHARSRTEVLELSLGDYVLNGGEAAALVLIEAVVRLLPGVVGNAESLIEESHQAGLLEAPVYTKPPHWRGLEVPAVLRSGDHGQIAAWRRQQALERTARVRPDLVSPRVVPGGGEIRAAVPADAGELHLLDRACRAGATADRQPEESPAEVGAWPTRWTVLVLRRAGRLIGAARARMEGTAWVIDRLLVAPDQQGQGLSLQLLTGIEAAAPPEATAYQLIIDEERAELQRRLRKAGYRSDGRAGPGRPRLRKGRLPAPISD